MVFRYLTIGRLWRKAPHAEVYLSLNDPHSFMLVQMLSRVAKNYRIDFKVLFIWGTMPGITISPKLYRQWAIKDANDIAKQYQLVNITAEPSSASLTTGQQTWQFMVNSLQNAEEVFIATWGNHYTEHFQTSTPTINHQVKNQIRLTAKGHYSPASIFLAGSWFVGVDRLYHFENMLLHQGLLDKVSPEFGSSPQLDEAITATAKVDVSDPLVIYLSLRSPYSYLGLVQAINVAERNNLALVIKPILPLLMRGASIPIVKQKYIYLDAVREAHKLGIEFNGFVDPLGDGVINVYRLFAWAQQQGKATEYMLACFRAIYVDGIDLSIAENVNTIFTALTLEVDDALAYQHKHDWQQWADINQMNLTQLEFWGVPCVSFAEHSYWGQDRILTLEKEINNAVSKS